MAKVKVHVTLKAGVAATDDAKKLLLKAITSAGVSGVNQSRFDRYGLVSGMANENALDRIREVEGVRAVEVDKTRHLM